MFWVRCSAHSFNLVIEEFIEHDALDAAYTFVSLASEYFQRASKKRIELYLK